MNSKGISEVVSTILVIILVIVLAAIIFAVASGTLQQYFVKKSAFVATKAGVADSPASLLSGIPNQLLALQPLNGDPFYLLGQQQPQPNGYALSIQIQSPDGKTITPSAQNLSGPLYGKTLYIYPSPQASGCSYTVSESIPYSPPPMTTGPWQIRMVDQDNHILVYTQKLDVKGTSSTLPSVGGLMGSGGNTMYRADCTVIPQTLNGNLPESYNATMNMNTTYFDGSSWITLPNDPSLSFTGNMAISLWLDPTTAGDPNDPNSWHQILGKGSITGGVENDNYQLFQMGNKLVFEWNDATNPAIHYQAVTDTGTISANSWNYVTVSVSGGTIQIYNNGVSQPLIYNQGLDPRYASASTPAPVVSLQGTTNPVTVGKQNAPGSEFYYQGSIGAIDLYNRGLTQAEIDSNLQNYRA